MEKERSKTKVILGLSGGVDSATSLINLKEQGYDVEAVFMRNWDSTTNNDFLGNPTINDDVCPQEKDFQDAKSVADKLGIKLHRVDFINEYCVGKKVLLISQGSVLRGMQILLRKRNHPWDDFTVEGMYHVGDDTNKKKNYGVIAKVY